jgi:hypothetical protein
VIQVGSKPESGEFSTEISCGIRDTIYLVSSSVTQIRPLETTDNQYRNRPMRRSFASLAPLQIAIVILEIHDSLYKCVTVRTAIAVPTDKRV